MAAEIPGYPSSFARMQHVLELRREGKTYRQIADQAGLKSEHAAQAMVSRAIKRVLRETAEEVRSVELSRLEVLIQCLWDKAIKDVNNLDPMADRYGRFDRLHKLLETKLKWCGAQAVEDHTDKSVHITINKFTDAQPAPPKQLNQPLPTMAQIEALTQDSDDSKVEI